MTGELSQTPWRIVEDGEFGCRLECPQGGIIALNPEISPDDADWLLLQAAPDLLAACEMAARTLRPGRSFEHVIRVLDTAIAQAHGVQP